jgi:tetratricopeptide (TPR) repeat protein
MADRRRWAAATLLTGGLVLGVALSLARADEVDDALALPAGQAVARLESLLDRARTAEAAGDAGPAERAALERVLEALARFHRDRGETYAALQPLEELVRRRERAADRLAYADALLLLAEAAANGTRAAPGGGVEPYLRDALATIDPIDVRAPQDGAGDAGLRARAAYVRAKAQYMLGELDAALVTVEAVAVSTLGKADAGRLLDLRARCFYARQAYERAGEAWLAAGDRIAAAAAFDAGRLPARSVPIYAELIREQPSDAALVRRALVGVRFTGANGALATAIADVEIPAGTAGLALLRARAQLAEATGKPDAAMGFLEQVAQRDASDAAALVDLARLTIMAGREDEAAWSKGARHYIEAIQREPDSERAAAGLSFIAGRDYGLLWKRWKDAELVRRCLAVQFALVEADPQDALSLANLGNTLRTLGRHEEALAMYERAREANPYDPGVESDAGLALSAAGRDEDSLAAYERSIELDSGHLAGRQNAARSLWLLGRDEDAARHLGAATRIARAVGRSADTYRFLLDRTWRTRQNAVWR